MAQNAKATAEEVDKSFWDFTSNVKDSKFLKSGGMRKNSDAGEDTSKAKEELEKHGITDDLITYVKAITPKEFLAKSKEWPKEDKDSWRLTPWQEKHVLLILGQVKELRDCRFLLTPKKMSEQRFWEIYFALSQKHLFQSGNKKDQGDQGGVSNATKDMADLEISSGEIIDEEGTETGEREEGDIPDDISDDLEAYLESVLANKDVSDEEDGEEDDDDANVDDDLADYINELEEDMGSLSEEIVKVEKIEGSPKSD